MKKTIFFSMLFAIGVSPNANPSVVINDNNKSNAIADNTSKVFSLNKKEISESILSLEPTIVTKKPWWLVLIEIEILFGHNIPGHECVYNSICKITVGSAKSPKILNFTGEEELVRHINKFRTNNNAVLAVSENGEVLILTSLRNSSEEFNRGFELKYAPNISKDILRNISRYNSFKNMKIGRSYKPNIERGKYKYLKIN